MTPRDKRDFLLYGLLPGERQKLYAFQNGLDPISGRPLTPLANVDHNHRSGLVRGLLNPFTNKYLIDDLDILRASIAYLENPPAVRALGKVYGLIGKAQRKKKMLYGPDGSPAPQERSRGVVFTHGIVPDGMQFRRISAADALI